jgi:hypothetical protein
MARYLLIEVDNNDSADRMRELIDNADKPMRVVAMFAKPGALCECEVRSEKSVRGAKFGWWLCPECRRPKSGGNQTLRNLLDDEGTPAKYREIFLCVRWIKDLAGKIRTARSVPEVDWK